LDKGVEFDLIRNEKNNCSLFEKTAMQLGRQRPLQGDAGHPGQQGGGQVNNKGKGGGEAQGVAAPPLPRFDFISIF
jgi:hypothetical protein